MPDRYTSVWPCMSGYFLVARSFIICWTFLDVFFKLFKVDASLSMNLVRRRELFKREQVPHRVIRVGHPGQQRRVLLRGRGPVSALLNHLSYVRFAPVRVHDVGYKDREYHEEVIHLLSVYKKMCLNVTQVNDKLQVKEDGVHVQVSN
jgi:hypothetical protein